jgi:hypothetical protein
MLGTGKSILLTFLLVAIISFIKAFLTWGVDWKTQTVLYASMDNNRRTIKYQMQGNRFAFGYRERVIDWLKTVPLIDWTTNIDTISIDTFTWIKTYNTLTRWTLNNAV